ncbi:two-component system CheB/CheR fusion protein [Hoeflea marina]|uniref:Blue-light-activated histidine kinase n=1 Tax=Hoeflea marina TaxID=274592 RepID=A0A317PHC9_9HYPH|nr:CheR family methyltransferase [Hoeflea marina]PWV99842.1 two-component system CheB/CheR fusion protein [Hoeflea marina]
MAWKDSKFPVVGIGASAGGIPAMAGLFEHLPSDCGMAFVIVTHLSPERESLLHEVIARYTEMPVLVAEDGMQIESRHVYVMPENAILTIAGDRLKLRHPVAGARERKPIDIFLASLGESFGEYAAGVILSGGDSDGTLGVKVIKERGGLTMAQITDGSGPRNPDMPQSAISSGLIDIAATAEEMGAKLLGFLRSLETLRILDEAGAEEGENMLQEARDVIYVLLRSHSGHDFSGYKTRTFVRRIRRRMQVTQIESIDDYIQLLKKDPGEIANLFRDLLINVTNFFRDAEAFKALEEQVIPKIFENRGVGDSVRIWVPGCATGEEVFSIGMLVLEHMDTLSDIPQVHIFATDIDEAALGVARAARFPEGAMEGLSDERRKRFFIHEGASYLLRKDVRELCIFSPHSVIREPPFSRMDLVSCRNLLIYFGPEVQNRVIPTFHYALKPGGFLFLGTSESVGRHTELFATIDKKHRIYQAREHNRMFPRLPSFPGAGVPNPSSHVTAGIRSVETMAFPLRQSVESQVLERFAPAHVVVNRDGDVVYYSAGTGKYLEPPQGAPNRQLLTMARSGLRIELRSALREVIQTRKPIRRENVAVAEDGDRVQVIHLILEPLVHRGGEEQFFIVLFEPVGPSLDRNEIDGRSRNLDGTADLERELRETHEKLQSTIEEYETAMEELKSSNEELVSVNEESQSTNEELEASKEEMQSLNEELNTINAELTEKVEELDRANSDLKNLFESTQIATIFLDRNLVIRNFTPAASSFFNLRPADIGRPLTELASRLDYPELKQHIARVFKTGEMIEHQLARDIDRVHYLVRLIPYRDTGDRIYGVVVTLVDVTSLAEAESHQRTLIAELNHRVKNMLAVVISIANHTLKSAPTPEAFNSAFLGRLHAMARAYGLLSRENWKEALIDELVSQEMEPFGLDRVILSGPQFRLRPDRGLSLAMVVHELSTNAVKYGALSVPAGKVEINWSRQDGMLVFDWVERGGPLTLEPSDIGFGLTLLKGEIGYRHGGKVETNFAAEGLEVRIMMPVGREDKQ